MELAGIGLYSISEASRLTKATSAEIHRWVHGYRRKRQGERREYQPLWRPQVHHPSTIGFLDLLELKIVTEFIRHGVKLSVIRASIETARNSFKDDYPLTTHRFVTDGRRVFLD